MCIKIVYSNHESSYDMNESLEKQLVGSKQVVVNYEPNDPSIEKFFDEMEKFCQNGIACNVNLKVLHNDQLIGQRYKNQAIRAEKDLKVNELIRMMANCHAETDKKLEELANICLGKYRV